MAGVLQHLRSSTLNKRPNPASMVDGQIAINYASGSPGAFFKDSNGNLVKVGPVHVGATAPNVSPASGGTAGNSLGEQWLDTSGGTYVFKIWDGAAWRSESGTFVDVAGDTMTGNLTAPAFIPNGSSVPTNGVYLPAANSVAISTNSTKRLEIDANGNVNIDSNTLYVDAVNNRVGLGTSSPLNLLDVAGDISLSSGGSNVFRVLQNVNAAAYTGPGFYSQTSIGYGVASGGTHRWIGGGDGNTELMRLTSTGLGVGTASPVFGVGDGLEVARSGVATIRVSSNTQGVELRSDAGTGTLETRAGYPLLLGTSSTERARIDSSGRLLVGTSSARSPLTHTPSIQVEGLGYATSTVSVISNSNDTNGAYSFLGKSRGTSTGSNTIVQSGDEIGGLDFIAADGTQLLRAARITALVDGTPGANDMPGRLVFSVTRDGQASPTEALRVTNGGETRVFCVTAAQGLIINHSDTARNVYAFYEGRYSATDNSGGTGTRSYIVYTSGDVRNVNNSYGAISDLKLKENIIDANSQWDDLKALKVRNYNFKEGQTHTQIGLVAQEVELVSPGLVSESPDRDEDGNDLGTVTKSVNYSVLYMKAVKALQEAMERIETLEAKVAALESA